MIVSFKHKALEAFFVSGKAAKLQQSHLDKLRLILAQMNAAKEIRDLNFPGSNLHPLKGELKNHWSIKVNGNWRITFKFDRGDVYLIDYLDYH